MEKIMDIKTINKKIKSIAKRGKSLDKDIHETGVAIMQHAMAHHDYSAANRLVAALPKSGRTKAFIKWFSDHTPYNWNDTDKVFTLPKNKDKRRQFLISEAEAVPFWEYTVEKEPGEIDVDKMLANLFKRVETAKEQGREVKGEATLAKVAAALNAA
jgi:hypothetical protein